MPARIPSISLNKSNLDEVADLRSKFPLTELEAISTTMQAPPSFQPANYTFRVDPIRITHTRARHADSDKISVSVAGGESAPQTNTKDLGNLNDGTFPV